MVRKHIHRIQRGIPRQKGVGSWAFQSSDLLSLLVLSFMLLKTLIRKLFPWFNSGWDFWVEVFSAVLYSSDQYCLQGRISSFLHFFFYFSFPHNPSLFPSLSFFSISHLPTLFVTPFYIDTYPLLLDFIIRSCFITQNDLEYIILLFQTLEHWEFMGNSKIHWPSPSQYGIYISIRGFPLF